jgi:hypothetical protein
MALAAASLPTLLSGCVEKEAVLEKAPIFSVPSLASFPS